MTHLKLALRTARLRALLLVALAAAFGACDSADRLTNLSDDPALGSPAGAAVAPGPSFSSSFRGGIPFGTFHVPKAEYGSLYNGSLANIYPEYLLSYLEAARSSGTRIILSLVGGETNYQEDNHEFSLSKWKQRVDRYSRIDFSSYIEDGTIIGHYLIDEPHDRSNWGGTQISPATLDEMAQYSKERWPAMATIVRAWPVYLKGFNYRYLDAAWAQYAAEYGSPAQRLPIDIFTANNVRDAKASGLALVVGINLLGGGTSRGLEGFYPGEFAPSASELQAWGSVLLDDAYPCAFISWKYDKNYVSRPDIQAALSYLSEKARRHPSKSCRGNASGLNTEEPPPVEEPEEPPPPPVEEPEEPPPPVEEPQEPPSPPEEEPTLPSENPVPTPGVLNVSGSVKAKLRLMTLRWTGVSGTTVDVYRNGVLVKNTRNDGRYTNTQKIRGAVTYQYRVCARGTSNCSNTATASFR